MKVLLAACVLVFVSMPEAVATAQFEERIRMDGQELRLQSTPLEGFLDTLKERPAAFESPSSALWRGYRGTWALHCGRLWLVALHQMGVADELGTQWVPMRLDLLFPGRRGPIRASWYSGTLRVPQGRMIQYVHMGFGSVYESTLELNIVRGRLCGWRRESWRAKALRSRQDLRWTALGTPETGPASSWIDARWIAGAGFSRRGRTRFRTRGVYLAPKDGQDAGLWIPETSGTEAVTLTLLPLATYKPERTWPHVEVDVRLVSERGVVVLKVHSVRELPAGHTIHHPSFHVPREELEEPRSIGPERLERVSPFQEGDSREDALGLNLSLFGRVQQKDGIFTMGGIEVGRAQGAAELERWVEGVLEKWVVTARMLRCRPRRYRAFRRRGPGTYWRLVERRGGALAVPEAPTADAG